MLRLADLYCKAGGAARGYQLAGFHVTGVDIEAQPNFCGDAFIRADALEFDLSGFDAVHASPPCQRYIRGGRQRSDHPDLLPPTRAHLQQFDVPWVIENVPGAPMRCDVQLCGSHFGLQVRRHRWFEFDRPLSVPTPPCDHSGPIAGVYGHPHGRAGAWPGMLPSTLESWSRAMGIDWMTAAELADAIPPAYTDFVGRLLMDRCGAVR